MSTRAFACATVLSACSVSALRTAPPIDPNDRGHVLTAERGAERTLHLLGDALPSFDASDDAPLTLSLLAYDKSIDEIGFSRGLELATPGQRSIPLGPWARARTLVARLDGETTWEDGADASLAAVAVAAAPACRARYTTIPIILTSTAPIGVAYPDGPDHAMVSQRARSGTLWIRIDRGGGVALVPEPVPGLAPSAAVMAPDGVLFIAGTRSGTGHELWRRDERGFTMIPQTSGMASGEEYERLRWLSAPSRDAVWTMTVRGRVMLREPTGWTTVTEQLGGIDDERNFGGIAAIDARSADVLHPFANTSRERFVSRFRPARPAELIHFTATLPFAVAFSPELEEPLYGASDGNIDRLVQGRLEPLVTSAMAGATILALVPVRSGVWHGMAGVGPTSRAIEVYDSGEICVMSSTSINANRAVALGDGVLALGSLQAEAGSRERLPGAALIAR